MNCLQIADLQEHRVSKWNHFDYKKQKFYKKKALSICLCTHCLSFYFLIIAVFSGNIKRGTVCGVRSIAAAGIGRRIPTILRGIIITVIS